MTGDAEPCDRTTGVAHDSADACVSPMARRREGTADVSAPIPLRESDSSQKTLPPSQHSQQHQDPISHPKVAKGKPDLGGTLSAESETPPRLEESIDNKENMDPSSGSSPVTCTSGGMFSSSDGKGVPLSLAATPVSAPPSLSTPLSGMPSLAATPLSDIQTQGSTPYSASSAGSLSLDLQILPPYAQRAASAYQATPGMALPSLQPSPCGHPASSPSPTHKETRFANTPVAAGPSHAEAAPGPAQGQHADGASHSAPQSQAAESPVLGGMPGAALPPTPCDRAMILSASVAGAGSQSPLGPGAGPPRAPIVVSAPGGPLVCPIGTPMSVAVNEAVEVR